jgi:hypothetical protein
MSVPNDASAVVTTIRNQGGVPGSRRSGIVTPLFAGAVGASLVGALVATGLCAGHSERAGTRPAPTAAAFPLERSHIR